MDNRPIGMFDSGLGGLTAVKEILSILPQEDIVYFGDTGRVPYGTRSKETIMKYAKQDMAFLQSKNVKMIIAACGTVSSVAGHIGEALSLPFTGVLKPTALAACLATHKKSTPIFRCLRRTVRYLFPWLKMALLLRTVTLFCLLSNIICSLSWMQILIL